MEILRAVHRKKYYGSGEKLVRAVDDVSFGIEKGSLSVISFALSGILFLVVYTVSMGYSVEVQTAAHNGTDFRIGQKAAIYGAEEPYQPVSQDLVQQIKDLEFVERLRTGRVGQRQAGLCGKRGTEVGRGSLAHSSRKK